MPLAAGMDDTSIRSALEELEALQQKAAMTDIHDGTDVIEVRENSNGTKAFYLRTILGPIFLAHEINLRAEDCKAGALITARDIEIV